MATSKTLTPTNVTISIPEMTDSPNASVFSNCVDKEADAINSLNSNIANLIKIQSESVNLGALSANDHGYIEKAVSVPSGYTLKFGCACPASIANTDGNLLVNVYTVSSTVYVLYHAFASIAQQQTNINVWLYLMKQ